MKKIFLSKFSFLKESFLETVVEALCQSPFVVVGILLYWWASSLEPSGSLIDFRIKFYFLISKFFVSVWLGQVLWNMLFPKLELDEFLKEPCNIEKEAQNYFWGRFILHITVMVIIMFSI